MTKVEAVDSMAVMNLDYPGELVPDYEYSPGPSLVAVTACLQLDRSSRTPFKDGTQYGPMHRPHVPYPFALEHAEDP